jgi:hypothetical protein
MGWSRAMCLGLIFVLMGCGPTSDGPGNTSDVETARQEVVYWNVEDIFALTDGGFVFIDQIPEGIQTFVDTPADDLLLLATFIRDEAGAIVGIATEQEEFHRPLTPEGRHDAIWTLLLGGRGSLIGHEIEVSTEETRAFLKRIQAMDGPWSGEFVAHGTIGPAANGMGVVVGGTGEFAGARGYMTEENIYRNFDGTTYDVRTRLTFYLTN